MRSQFISNSSESPNKIVFVVTVQVAHSGEPLHPPASPYRLSLPLKPEHAEVLAAAGEAKKQHVDMTVAMQAMLLPCHMLLS